MFVVLFFLICVSRDCLACIKQDNVKSISHIGNKPDRVSLIPDVNVNPYLPASLAVIILSCLFGTLVCSLSRNGSSWQSWPQQSASLAWRRSVCTKLRIMADYCCWPQPPATSTWWANWPRGQRRTARPMWPFSPISFRGSKCLTTECLDKR